MIEETRTNKDMDEIDPATDIVETENGFFMYMDLPGVKKKDLNIDVEENVLVIAAKATKQAVDGEIFIQQEFGSGDYRRRFNLAVVVDPDNIRANLKNGVLELFLPRKNATKPRKIKVSQSD